MKKPSIGSVLALLAIILIIYAVGRKEKPADARGMIENAALSSNTAYPKIEIVSPTNRQVFQIGETIALKWTPELPGISAIDYWAPYSKEWHRISSKKVHNDQVPNTEGIFTVEASWSMKGTTRFRIFHVLKTHYHEFEVGPPAAESGDVIVFNDF